jgi:hypothetical protein
MASNSKKKKTMTPLFDVYYYKQQLVVMGLSPRIEISNESNNIRPEGKLVEETVRYLQYIKAQSELYHLIIVIWHMKICNHDLAKCNISHLKLTYFCRLQL